MDQKSPEAFRTISEVADWLGVPAHVLRFWESRFGQVKPVKRAGGRRYYRPSDMELLGGIRKLLHEDGLTIRGVQKLLREKGVKYVAAMSPPLDQSAGMKLVEDADDTAELARPAPVEAPRDQVEDAVEIVSDADQHTDTAPAADVAVEAAPEVIAEPEPALETVPETAPAAGAPAPTTTAGEPEAVSSAADAAASPDIASDIAPGSPPEGVAALAPAEPVVAEPDAEPAAHHVANETPAPAALPDAGDAALADVASPDDTAPEAAVPAFDGAAGQPPVETGGLAAATGPDQAEAVADATPERPEADIERATPTPGPDQHPGRRAGSGFLAGGLAGGLNEGLDTEDGDDEVLNVFADVGADDTPSEPAEELAPAAPLPPGPSAGPDATGVADQAPDAPVAERPRDLVMPEIGPDPTDDGGHVAALPLAAELRRHRAGRDGRRLNATLLQAYADRLEALSGRLGHAPGTRRPF